jgi:IS5 family transposase
MQTSLFGEVQDKADAMEREVQKFSNKDPLIALEASVNWNIFSSDLKKFRKLQRKNDTGRKPFDQLMMFKILILQSLYNLSDEAMEFMIHDRLSFMRFLGLGASDRIPDARTIWRFRDELSRADMAERLFARFNEHLRSIGLITNKGQIIDASVVQVPGQHITGTEKEVLDSGETPAEWNENKKSHKDRDATWTKKYNKSYYGYKNHVQVDQSTKVIRKYAVTTASTHDSQVFEELLDIPEGDGDRRVYADSAYKSEYNESILEKYKLTSCVLRRAYRNKKLTNEDREQNKEWSRIRSRVEHVFGMQYKMVGDLTVRSVGYVRVRCIVGLRNLSYNMTRLVYFMRQGCSVA